MTTIPEEVPEPFEAFLLIGSNIGQRVENLDQARKNISNSDINILEKSSIYESAAWGKEDQQNFVNQVLKIQTMAGPWELLDTILKIEIAMGRERKEKWAERTIDIDILYFEEVAIQSFDLIIPHPGIPERRFTLMPLVEIAAEKIHPKLNKSQVELLEICIDDLQNKTL